MIRDDQRYSKYHPINEMLDTVEIIHDFKHEEIIRHIPIDHKCLLMLTGEGSSRIFPAKNIRHHRMAIGMGPRIFTEGSLQLLNYNLKDYIIN